LSLGFSLSSRASAASRRTPLCSDDAPRIVLLRLVVIPSAARDLLLSLGFSLSSRASAASPKRGPQVEKGAAHVPGEGSVGDQSVEPGRFSERGGSVSGARGISPSKLRPSTLSPLATALSAPLATASQRCQTVFVPKSYQDTHQESAKKRRTDAQRLFNAKIVLFTFVPALALATAMGIAEYKYCPTSTPGLRLLVANFPGVIVALWVSLLTGDDNPVMYIVCALANWAFYFGLLKGLLLLKWKLSN
jgi:hypothetical protein